MPRSPVQIRIRNFQALEDVSIEVDGFTCITGPTNIGKSSIIRAVAAAMKNDAVTGDVRLGARFCSVEARSDGWGFTWEKGEKNGVNRYLVDGEERHRDKVGQGQIPAVAEMGFGSVDVGSRDVWPWHAEQFDPTFLVRETGPAVTEFFSEVTRLKVLQDAVGIALKGKGQSLEAARVRQKDVEELEAKLARVDAVDGLSEVEQGLRLQAQSIAEYEARLAVAEQALEATARCQAAEAALAGLPAVRIPAGEPEGLADLVAAVASLAELEAAARSVIEVRQAGAVVVPDVPPEFDQFARLIPFQGLPALQEQVRLLEASDVEIPDADHQADVARLKELEELSAQLLATAHVIRGLQSLPGVPDAPEPPPGLLQGAQAVMDASRLRTELEELRAQEDAIAKELEAVEADLASIPSCPTCGRVAESHPH